MAFDAAAEKGSAYTAGSIALFLSIAAILTALGFQHFGGYQPCMLCLMERYAYYFAIPALFLAIVLSAGGNKGWAAALFFVVSLAFLANAGLATYHAGAEWKFWPGPESCGGGGALSASAGSLLKDLEGIKVVRCDEAALRVLGVSFAGWNVVASLLLMAVCLKAAFAASAARTRT
ncbi:MAG: disulfide bond formation protein B [Hyphomicrobium sp.]